MPIPDTNPVDLPYPLRDRVADLSPAPASPHRVPGRTRYGSPAEYIRDQMAIQRAAAQLRRQRFTRNLSLAIAGLTGLYFGAQFIRAAMHGWL